MKKTCLITGASGFIGSCLLRRLVDSHEDIHIILRKGAKTWRIADIISKVTAWISDLSNMEELSKIIDKVKPDIIYHLATHGAYSYQTNPDEIIKTNILGTWNLLKAASNTDYGLFLNTGSSSEYGFKKEPMREDDILAPASYYAVTKSSQTLLCAHVAREEKRSIVTLRPFSVYGPYEEPTRFIPTLMRSLYSGRRMSLVSPQISRDHVYIDDVVGAYLLTDKLKKYPGEIFNIGSGIQSSIKDVVSAAVEVTGRTTDFEWGKMEKRAWDTDRWVADISKAEKLLGWAPKVDLKKGLSMTWAWFKNNVNLYKQSEVKTVHG